MTAFTFNGKTYNTTEFPGYGWVEEIVAGTGDTLPRWVAALVDGIVEAARLRTTTSASSITPASSGSITVVCATDVQFVVGSDILVTDGATKQIWATVTAYNATTKTITATAYKHNGSGAGTSWTVTTTGALGAAGIDGTDGTDGIDGTDGADGTFSPGDRAALLAEATILAML